jgi:hypothetical protein
MGSVHRRHPYFSFLPICMLAVGKTRRKNGNTCEQICEALPFFFILHNFISVLDQFSVFLLQGYVPVSAGSDQGASFGSTHDNIMVLILFPSDIIKKP